MTENTPEHSTAINFPCDFTFKIMGKANDSFEINALSIIKKYFPDLKENSIRQQHSKGKNYLALSITVYAEDKSTVDNVYQELSQCSDVMIAL